jgi:hypothetical protein
LQQGSAHRLAASPWDQVEGVLGADVGEELSEPSIEKSFLDPDALSIAFSICGAFFRKAITFSLLQGFGNDQSITNVAVTRRESSTIAANFARSFFSALICTASRWLASSWMRNSSASSPRMSSQCSVGLPLASLT